MSDLVIVAHYWPFFVSEEKRQFTYKAADGSVPDIVSVFSYDPSKQSMCYSDYYENGNWKDTWFYRYQPGFGVSEWRDDYPGKTVVMSPPIGWGDIVRIGGTFYNEPKMDTLRCSPWQIGHGKQWVAFERVEKTYRHTDGQFYNDVLVFMYQQQWGDGDIVGARYWMAADIGPIAIQWLGKKNGVVVESTRMDAEIKIRPLNTATLI